MNLLEFENQQFGDVWNEETINELRSHIQPHKRYQILFPKVDRTNEGWEMKQDEYYMWRGWRIPKWFE